MTTDAHYQDHSHCIQPGCFIYQILSKSCTREDGSGGEGGQEGGRGCSPEHGEDPSHLADGTDLVPDDLLPCSWGATCQERSFS